MFQAIVILPKGKGVARINAIRRRYDPQFRLVRPHVTLAYPFRDIPEKVIDSHIKEAISGINPFSLRLEGVRKSPKEYYLYLLVDDGLDSIVRIHKRLYKKLLKKRTDIPYIPHLTLGVFKSKAEIDRAYNEVKNGSLDFTYTAKEIVLLTVADDLATPISARKYALRSGRSR